MVRCMPLVLLAALLSGCGTTIKNEYTVTGNSNTFHCDSTAGQDKTVDSRLGVSAAATAAASQNGDASNNGAADAHAVGDRP